MSKNETITLTPEELQLLLEAMEDEEFVVSIPLLLSNAASVLIETDCYDV